jgi:hypothetical protein
MTDHACRERQTGVAAHGGRGTHAAAQRIGGRRTKSGSAARRQGRHGSRAAVAGRLRLGRLDIGVLTPSAGTAVLYLLGCIAVGLVAADLWQRGDHVGAVVILLVPPPAAHITAHRVAAGRRDERAAVQSAAVEAFLRAIEVKDPYTRGHSERVAQYAAMIGSRLGLPEDRVTVLAHAAALHDLGKLGVPSTLLRKAGPLDHGEYAEMRLHAERGADLMRGLDFSREVRDAVLHHHERLDGEGYPDGLAGSRIPYFARIIAVADAYDAMTSTRSYRAAMPVPDALAELRHCAGTQFDPVAVEALADAVDALERDRAAAAAQSPEPEFEVLSSSAAPSPPVSGSAAEPEVAPDAEPEPDESVLYNAPV